jgi:hypothetical protein
VVDWDGLENRCALTGTVGSNPTLSATCLFVSPRWAVHLLFIPCVVAVMFVGAWLLHVALRRPATDEPADQALIPAILLLGLVLFVHAAALIFDSAAAIRRRPKSG